MKKSIALIVIPVSIVCALRGAQGQTETKKEVEEKEPRQCSEQIMLPAIALGNEKVQFYWDDKKIKFELLGVNSADTVKIFDAKDFGDRLIIAGVVDKSTAAANKIFVVEFTKNEAKNTWRYPRILNNKTIEEIALLANVEPITAATFDKGTEWVKTLSTQVVGEEVNYVLVFAGNAKFKELYVFGFWLEKARWGYASHAPFGSLVNPKEGYEEARIAKITGVSCERTKNRRLLNFSAALQVAGVKSGYPVTIDYSWLQILPFA